MKSLYAAFAATCTLTVALVAAFILPASVSAATTADPVAAAAGWLSTQFEDGTHLPVPAGDHFDAYDSSFGYYANQGENADVVFGLAAAKSGSTKSGAALNYLASTIDDYADVSAVAGGPYDGAVAKAALAAIIGGRSATSFGGHNLLQTLKADECAPVSPATTCAVTGPLASTRPAGSAANIYSSISESFVIMAEARGGATYAPSAASLSYLLSLQCADGGFTSGVTACAGGAADLDATSYAIMALQAAGGHASALANAVTYLSAQRGANGSWGTGNVNSTGLATAALDGQSVNVSTSRTWLRSQQISPGSAGAGALNYTGAFTPTAVTAGTSPSVLATAQGLTGLVAGGSLATLTSAGSSAGFELFAAKAAAEAATVVAGKAVTVTGAGFAAGEQVSADLNSTPLAIGLVVADPSGRVSLTFTVPATFAAGSHTVTFTGASSAQLATTAPFTVTAVPVATPGTAAAELANTGTSGRLLVMLGMSGLFALLSGAGLLLLGRRRRIV